jgi:hypothetical protein
VQVEPQMKNTLVFKLPYSLFIRYGVMKPIAKFQSQFDAV